VLQAIIGFIMSGLYDQLKRHIAGFAVTSGIFFELWSARPWQLPWSTRRQV
jgi:hypothetical protein